MTYTMSGFCESGVHLPHCRWPYIAGGDMADIELIAPAPDLSSLDGVLAFLGSDDDSH